MTLRVGLIGAGYFAGFHVDAWNRIDGTALVAVADPDTAKASRLHATTFTDAGTMLGAQAPDIVDIATPPASHLAMIRLALPHAPRAILCQKPFCTSLAEAQEATALAQAAGIPLLIHENFRFQPWYRAMKRMLSEGALGTPYQLSFTLRTGDGQGPRAYLDRQPYFQTMPRFLIRETGVHWIDTFRYLLGHPSAVDADLRRINPVIAGEDAGRFTFRYEDGRRAVFDGNRCMDTGAETPRLTFGTALLEGSEGVLRLSPDGALHHRRFGQRGETVVLPARDYPGFAGDCVFALQSHVIAALAGEAPFENEAADYLAVLHLEAAIYRADAQGRVIDTAV